MSLSLTSSGEQLVLLMALLLVGLAVWLAYRRGKSAGSMSDQARAGAERLRVVSQEDLRATKTQAAQLNDLDEAKSRFFANISYEFQTPLTLTLGPLL